MTGKVYLKCVKVHKGIHNLWSQGHMASNICKANILKMFLSSSLQLYKCKPRFSNWQKSVEMLAKQVLWHDWPK
jgi:hypothetical protein